MKQLALLLLLPSLAFADLSNLANQTVSSASLTSVNNAITSFTILSANSSRNGLIIFNNSSTTCEIAFASTASTSAFTLQLTGSATYVMTAPIYLGIVSGICMTATGALQVTEL